VFDGRMLGLNGQVVTYPQWFFLLLKNAQRRLNRIAREEKYEPVRIIERDGSGLWRVLPEVKRQLGDLLLIPNYNPRRKLHASDPGYRSGRPRHCGKRGLIDLLEEGVDTTRQDIAQCEADLEDSRRSQVRINQILEEVRQLRNDHP
jgi:hypothetical protein